MSSIVVQLGYAKKITLHRIPKTRSPEAIKRQALMSTPRQTYHKMMGR
ncbi:Hypothetical protein I595_3180 [Croceitalea dokdonensis DOKDO 023]|uniref:Uncharacterized protein n=1 Tax=Croceitalea dokdonensis DOKDO 023 TaxID=1300341 RepID=A0A0N8H3I7_9FLAO|nr:Hypothetical protein I595_3180 [Croceitalea dokdonensis DOKDO 023]